MKMKTLLNILKKYDIAYKFAGGKNNNVWLVFEDDQYVYEVDNEESFRYISQLDKRFTYGNERHAYRKASDTNFYTEFKRINWENMIKNN